MRAIRTRRRRWSSAAFAILVSLGILLAIPSTALAWEDCPFGEVDCEYPGICPRYVDTNNDGICDHSQPEPTDSGTATGTVTPTDPSTTDQSSGTSTDEGTTSEGRGRHRGTTAAVTESSDDTTPPSATLTSETSADTDTGGNALLTHYYVSPIAIGFLLVYAISFVLYKTKRIKIATHRKIWNVLLLGTFLITGLFGLILTIQLDYRLPFSMPVDLLFWHVEAGIVMTLISVFHIAWHFKYYAKMLRTSRRKARVAESIERYPAQRGTARGQVPYVPERMHALESRSES